MFVLNMDQLLGLRLIDQDGEYVADEIWYDHVDGQWLSHELGSDQVILGLLCNTMEEAHISRLGFLFVTLPPRKLLELAFGDTTLPWTDQYPSEYMLPHTTFDEEHLLSEIRMTHDQVHFGLTGIQLAFSNGIETPMFSSPVANSSEVSTITVD